MAKNTSINLKQQIADKLNLSSFSAPQQQKIISGLTENISNRINLAVFERLTEEERKELQKLAKANKKAGVLKFLNSKIDDLQSFAEQIAVETIDEFKKIREG
jgi:translation elongation factor EF-Ts